MNGPPNEQSDPVFHRHLDSTQRHMLEADSTSSQFAKGGCSRCSELFKPVYFQQRALWSVY
jgi:hypothetical protein